MVFDFFSKVSNSLSALVFDESRTEGVSVIVVLPLHFLKAEIALSVPHGKVLF